MIDKTILYKISGEFVKIKSPIASIPLNLENRDFSYDSSPFQIIRLSHIFVTSSGLVSRRLKIVVESIPRYKGKQKLFLQSLIYNYFVKRRIKLKEKKYVVIHNYWCPGYFHWITEGLIRLLIVKNHYKDDFTLVLPEAFKSNKSIIESLKTFGDLDIFWIPKGKNLSIEQLILPSNPTFTGIYNPKLIKQLVRKISEYVSKLDFKIRTGKKIYVSRKKSRGRVVTNEKELENVLVQQGYNSIAFEDYSFYEQVYIMQNAKYFISIHGAGVTNLIFMPANGFVVELQIRPEIPENYSPLYLRLASICDINYASIFCDGDGNNIYSANLHVDLNELKKVLEVIHNE